MPGKRIPRYASSSLLFILWIITALPAYAFDRPPGDSAAGSAAQLLATLPTEPVSYSDTIRPILERRCVVCHGCYDAPCQLKLSSLEGLQRGASKLKVYDGTRIRGIEPTRLGIDAKSADEWRDKGFHPILNEGISSPQENLEQSTLFQLLQLKHQHPQPEKGRLPDDFDLGLDREQVCVEPGEFERYARRHPLWGMPYAMPNLSDADYTALSQWIAQGTPAEAATTLPDSSAEQVKSWETFLNGGDIKQQLVSRYLYEHLFIAHLHFSGAAPHEFFRLVRSYTPPGKAIEEIPTTRPYDDPGTKTFFYRLRPYQASIVAKNHVVYELSPEKMARYRELFITPSYTVETLPSYKPRIAANPFRTFADIPPESRYRFMLDDARFFIEGFMKGPVCRGQIALNVIEDNFWVFFFSPDTDMPTLDPVFLEKVADDLEIPTERGDTFRLFAAWTKYWHRLTGYIDTKQAYYASLPQRTLDQAMEFIWDGDGSNRNAALTVFRHFDSASVDYGLRGNYPETAWIIDYPVFERIHYLLVAGFNVYGNVGHQLNTRLYMDFLRMESEDHFLAFLPAKQRKEIRDSWYVGLRSSLEEHLNEPSDWLSVEAVVGYGTRNHQRTLYQAIEKHLGPMAGDPDYINRCPQDPCEFPEDAADNEVDRALTRVAALRGEDLEIVPDLSFLRVRRAQESGRDLAYTLVHNKAYENITSMFADAGNERRDRQNDTLTVLKGLHGAYPNFFFEIEMSELEAFTREYAGLRDEKDHRAIVARYGIRRTDPHFWETADWFHDYAEGANPELHGLFDLNRYQNR